MVLVRSPPLRCLLLLLVVAVVCLTVGLVGYISKCVRTREEPTYEQWKKGIGFNYYQAVNDEEESENVNQLQPDPPGKISSALHSERKTGVREDNAEQGMGVDYPFEEDEGQGPETGAETNNRKDINTRLTKKGDAVVSDVMCDINNGKQKIGCKKDSSDVYIPFSFIHKYFEVYGKLEEPKEGAGEIFTWLHSFVKIYRPSAPYNPKGIFTYFENYNVEVRDRVKCISGAEGVPVSTQWDVNGYFYPIQIAQFGLSHFSKFLTEGEPQRLVLEDGDDTRGGWVPDEFISTLPNDNDPGGNHFVQFQVPNTGDLSVKLDVGPTKSRMLMLSWQMRVISEERHANITLMAKVRYESQVYYLHYVLADYLIQAKGNNVFHGLGYKSLSNWQHTIRDLGVDLQKGINAASPKMKKSKILKVAKGKVQLESITISCTTSGALILLDNMTLSTNEHLAQFYQAADWFVAHQDIRGGWPIPVRRKFGSDFYPVLEEGWYSAMGQGHALSLLARAYTVTTNNSLYAEACSKAVATIFDRSGAEHGVRAIFMQKYVWYEEYPTIPSSFVLNGFMYALLGLYDVKSVGVMGAYDKAASLYAMGIESLKAMLPLYDTGSGTFYDLRHFTVPGISPNLARLDYHVTHINQLLSFSTFEKDPIFKTTAERWIGYTEGNRAAHN